MSIIERQLQLCLNKLKKWATDNRFQFSETLHIFQKRGLHIDPQLFSGQKSTVVWGVIFDRKLSFVPHLKC